MVSLQGRSQSCAIKKLKFKEKKNRSVKKFFFISKELSEFKKVIKQVIYNLAKN